MKATSRDLGTSGVAYVALSRKVQCSATGVTKSSLSRGFCADPVGPFRRGPYCEPIPGGVWAADIELLRSRRFSGSLSICVR